VAGGSAAGAPTRDTWRGVIPEGFGQARGCGRYARTRLGLLGYRRGPNAEGAAAQARRSGHGSTTQRDG
jgi:hypothetical protein